METPELGAGIPARDGGKAVRKTPGAAALCRAFMENEGWAQLFSIARGEPQRAIVRHKLSGRAIEVKITPDVDQRLTAYRHVTSYGYGRPAELATADDSGRTVTDLLLAALRSPGRDDQGAQ